MDENRREVDALIAAAAEQGASDLHITTGYYPMLRIDGVLVPLSDREIIDPERAQTLAYSLLNEKQRQRFEKEHELDFAFSYQEKIRLRANVYYQRGHIGLALRLVPYQIPTLEDLNLPRELRNFTRYRQGFVIITGPTGHGKSTTLAALIDEINRTRAERIVTIEDPIEYVFTPDQSIIGQREVGFDTLSFRQALRASFRQDIDVLMIGELRDRETISTAVSAAETGHLVFSTLHTNSASQTLDRIVDAFPSEHQRQIRLQLASALLGVVSQRLVPHVNGGLVPAVEMLVANHAVRNLIRENKFYQLDMVIETGSDEGMISLNRSLAGLVREGKITTEHAKIYSNNLSELNMLLNG